ncbi:MAG: hypothetical protein Q9177_003593 [Variospora cf. flavescens]
MFDFPSSRKERRLDIVSILAVLGESNIKIHAQAITASRFCLLPRLFPAPQALLRESRPKRLPYVEEVTVYGVRTGEKRDAAVSSAIKLTRSTGWVRDHQIVPRSAAWNDWLEMAEEQLDNDDWDAKRALDGYLLHPT